MWTIGKLRRRTYYLGLEKNKALQGHPSTTQSEPSAPLYPSLLNIRRLLKIIGGILRDLYSLKRLSPKRQEEVTQSYDNRLIQWRDDLSDFLGITNTDMLMPLFRRQHTVLQLAYSQAIILLHRKALLIKPSPSKAHQGDALQPILQYGVQRCLDAATTIVTKLRDLIEKQQMYSAFWACTSIFSLTI